MKLPYAVYLLQVQWVWDHFNTEYATLTVEGQEGQRYESGFEILVDPKASRVDKEQKLSELREVAEALDRWGGDPAAKLVRLYRVVDQEGMYNPVGAAHEIRMKLETVCEFDAEGNPVAPARQHAAA